MSKINTIILFAGLICGCQSALEKVDNLANDSGLTKSILKGSTFDHIIYSKPDQEQSRTLHIYIEGDGSPWEYGTIISDDPTPESPLLLELMLLDSATAIYLGRPCYFGLADQGHCNNTYWTSHRYAPEVVDSMAQAANGYIKSKQFSYVTLIGHSGGGALAVLLADKVLNVDKVITIAANLDTQQWTQYHGYLPLTGSLNPMMAAQLTGIKHSHYAGMDDRVVPVNIISEFVRKHDGSLHVIKDFTHQCCWKKNWLQMLSE